MLTRVGAMMLAKKYAKKKLKKKILKDPKLKKKMDKIGKKAAKKEAKKKDNKKTTDTLGRKIYRGEERKKHEGYIKDVVQPRRRKAKQEAEAKKVGGKELRQLRKEAKLRSAERKLRHRNN